MKKEQVMRLIVMLVLFLCVGQSDASAQLFGGQLKRGKGTVTSLSCGSVVHSGNLYAASTANSFTSFVPYSGGNGGVFSGQVITSTGVTGLTATANQQSLAMGSGYVIYTITGIPSAAGTASFAINIGGQTCTITATVQATSAQYPVGSVFCASGASAVVELTNPATGKTWMDRNLGASQVATSSTDVNAYGDLYQWGRRSDGHQCRTSAIITTLSSVDQPAHGDFIRGTGLPYDWRSPQNVNLWQGVNGVNNPCPISFRVPTNSELQNEYLSWNVGNSDGAMNSNLKIPMAGNRFDVSGLLGNVGSRGMYWTSTTQGTTASFLNFSTTVASISVNYRAGGFSLRCIKESPAIIGSLNCGSMTLVGNIFSGQASAGVTITVPYSGGNGGYYPAQTITSTGITGLTATLASGFLASGSGTIVYTVTGTPSAAGTANFAINLAGQICSFTLNIQSLVSQYPAGSVFCGAGATAIVDVTNPTTGKTWMDRNLGATQVASSSTNDQAYGDLYQWGRRSDGHQCRTSATTATLSSVDQPGNGNFILAPTIPNDWRSPQNNNLWQGINGVNNPCPSGYRIATEIEFNLDQASWSQPGSFWGMGPLKFTMGGRRNQANGVLENVNSRGGYWTSSVNSTFSRNFTFTSGNSTSTNDRERALGYSIRCIKETIATLGALNCGSATQTGSVYSSQVTSGVTVTLPYDGGNGGFQATQTYNSTGVTGLIATLTPGLIVNGSGNFTFTISGTALTPGTANFSISIGGQNCSFSVQVNYNALVAQYPAGSIFCASGPTVLVQYTSTTTGRIWMDRNLGASQAATNINDQNALGDLYQWGRGNDGHQCRTSATTATLSSIDQPGNGNFILTSTTPFDWRLPQNNNLWQGVNGINNPCPMGYRLPTAVEMNNESYSSFQQSWTIPGRRLYNTGVIQINGNNEYWSSSKNGIYGVSTYAPGNGQVNRERANGLPIRCIKEIDASVGSLSCNNAVISGLLIEDQPTNSVTASIPYAGGNGGYYSSQSILSTGVTGLIAVLNSGPLLNGSGSLLYSITGTPNTSGIAVFSIAIGNKSCSFSIPVQVNLIAQYPVGSVFCTSGPTAIVDVTNPTTGKIWMDRNLGASQVATSSTDAASYGDLYQWGRGNDGHQCRNSATTATLSSTDTPANGNFIIAPSAPSDWRSPQNVNLWQGVNGVNNPCPSGYRIPMETEINSERLSWSVNTSVGAFDSPLKLPMAGYRNSIGTLVGNTNNYYWNSAVSGINSRYIAFVSGNAFMSQGDRANGFAVRCIKDASVIPAILGTLDCGSTSTSGILTSGVVASGVSASVPYSGGNGGSYSTQMIASTGVTGLTATLNSGILSNGSGSFSLAITGTPTTSGTASFALTIGGQSCVFTISVQIALAAQYPAGSVFCASGPTTIVDVTNPTTGKTWMDRNLGASQAATSSSDAAAYGDLYQWGRGNDGHQCRTSPTTSTLSSTDQPGHGNFIISNITPNDWRSPQNNNLWQGVNGINNPCPMGYRVPTLIELEDERLSWISNNASGAFASLLKFTLAGDRNEINGILGGIGSGAHYHSSTIDGVFFGNLNFLSFDAYSTYYNRNVGYSIRCIKN